MKLTLNVTPIIITVEKGSVFDNPLDKVYRAITEMQKINGIVKVGRIAEKDNSYMITIVGNIGNRREMIIQKLVENGCKTANYISDKEAETFVENQDIYT